MTRYRLVIPRDVQKQLDGLPAGVRQRLVRAVDSLADNPRPYGYAKLVGLRDEYRVRIGDYRVRYVILDDERVVLLISCKHRREAYR